MAFLVDSREESGGAALVVWMREQRTMRDIDSSTDAVERPPETMVCPTVAMGPIMKVPVRISNCVGWGSAEGCG
jgi:hypothetical protein